VGFEFATATRIVFGAGVVKRAGELAAELGTRALVVCGSDPSRAASLVEALDEQGVDTKLFAVSGEPTVAVAQDGVARARASERDLVVGFGGGSAIDTGKAIAALLANPGEPLDYLEVVGRGQALLEPSLPFVAIPTTAGTGAEVTRNAVLAVPAERVKVSLRNAHMLPRLALIDPELTYALPPAQTASTGLDALTQVLEPYVCRVPNPLVDAICREGMRRAARSLRRAFEDGSDAAAREDMALCSLSGGLALANAKLGAAHGLAGPIGGMFPAPHGAICARVLPAVVDVNVRALSERQADSAALHRYDEVARLLTGAATARAVDAVRWIDERCRDLQIPGLSHYGLGAADIPLIVDKSVSASSMQGNPIELTRDEVQEIVERSL